LDNIKFDTPVKTSSIAKILCDSCPAEGRFAAVKGTVTLKFCAHHARAHEASLLERKFTISPSNYKF
jgi:hypothetical protein